jgi:hypothetical protein
MNLGKAVAWKNQTGLVSLAGLREPGLIFNPAMKEELPVFFLILPDWLGDGKDYWLLALGGLIGTVTAVLLGRRDEGRRRLAELNLAKDALLERLHFNDDRIVQMLELFAVGKLTPDFTLDTTGIITWLSRSSGILTSETITAVNWHRYQLDHINSKLSIFYGLKTHDLTGGAENMRKSICEHLGIAHAGLANLRKLLTEEA